MSKKSKLIVLTIAIVVVFAVVFTYIETRPKTVEPTTLSSSQVSQALGNNWSSSRAWVLHLNGTIFPYLLSSIQVNFTFKQNVLIVVLMYFNNSTGADAEYNAFQPVGYSASLFNGNIDGHPFMYFNSSHGSDALMQYGQYVALILSNTFVFTLLQAKSMMQMQDEDM
ncbi:MAG: hypothetical protein QXU18_06875 [Thermoplasmatales archaeon]